MGGHISIHALLAESDQSSGAWIRKQVISIHALLAESDPRGGGLYYSIPNFYPRSPCGERHLAPNPNTKATEFLSTLSLRRATPKTLRHCTTYLFLSTLSLRRATCAPSITPATSRNFYPRSPCGERRCYSLRHSTQSWHFYPRSPCGERRPANWFDLWGWAISIHALLAESDWVLTGGLSCDGNFYPRSPCGERHVTFLLYNSLCQISIHALLAESDLRMLKQLASI